jgi:hypothetical protein
MTKGNKFLPYLIFGVPLLIGGFFLYKYVKSKKGGESNTRVEDDNNNNVDTKKTDTKKTTSDGSGSGVISTFPLKKGSRGSKVKEVQEALLKYDSKILPKYGADSDYGSETVAAVQQVLGKSTIDSQEDINTINSKATTKKTDEETKVKTKQVNDSRTEIADKLIALFKKNPSNNDFYAIVDTQVAEYKKTSDGRLYDRKIVVYKKGEKLPVSSTSTLSKNADGWILIWDNYRGKQYGISPYAFEVK